MNREDVLPVLIGSLILALPLTSLMMLALWAMGAF